MSNVPAPEFRELSRDDCLAVLARRNVGRIAFSYRDHVDIEPIHYQFADGWLYGRTAPGTKLRTLAHNRWVAFEVDDIRALFDWESVVVKGALYLLEKNGTLADNYAKAVEVLRHLVPTALDEDDPMPDRTVVFRIHTDQITGRAAKPGH